MSFNELKILFRKDPNACNTYALTTDVNVVDSKQLLESLEFKDGTKIKGVSNIPKILFASTIVQIYSDGFIGNSNQVKVFDGFNLLTLEIEDLDADFVEDIFELI